MQFHKAVRTAWRDPLQSAVMGALPCVPAPALVLIAGVATDHRSAALIAASAAAAIGFGGFKTIEGSPLPATVLASGGSALAAVAGSLAGHSLPVLAMAAFGAAALTAFLASVNEAVRWIALQSTITFLVAGNFPASFEGAQARGGLILAGGTIALVCVSGLQRLLGTARHPLWPPAPGLEFLRDFAGKARDELHRNLVHSGFCGLAVALSLLASRALDMPKSYWAPMTTLIVLKADYRSVGRRGLWRLVDTFVGGRLAGLVGFIHLGTPATLTLTIVLLLTTYMAQDAQYGVCTGVLTAWLVVLLGLGQHFEPEVAWHRAIFTLLGGILAIAMEMPRAAIHRVTDRGRPGDPPSPATDGPIRIVEGSCPKEARMIKAVIFDVDGTLVDSVAVHAKAWQEAFAAHGHDIPFEELRRQIGKGGDQLLPVFLSKDKLETQGDPIDRRRAEIVQQRFLPKIEAFPKVRALFERLRGDGIKIALASSAKGEELEAYKKKADIVGLVEEETSSDDAERSKPHGDIFQAALDRLPGIAPGDAVVVGDTPYDADAAGRVGLRAIGVRSGGFPDADLHEAGCVAIYDDPADLLARYAAFLKDAASARGAWTAL